MSSSSTTPSPKTSSDLDPDVLSMGLSRVARVSLAGTSLTTDQIVSLLVRTIARRKADVAPWCNKWTDWVGMGRDGRIGSLNDGVNYGASSGAENDHCHSPPCWQE